MTSTTIPRSIVVTGANKGIGYEAVKILAQRLPDATIYLTARSQSNGDGAVQKMKESVPNHDFSNVRILLLEVTDPSSISHAVAAVKEQCGSLDVLLHNSGILQVNGDLGAKGVFDVNVRAVKSVIDAFTPILTKDTGKIIVVSSEVGSWATNNLSSELQNRLLDSKTTTWDRVEAWMDDWQRHKQGQPGVQESWVPVDNMFNSGYGVSKAFLNSYLRHRVLDSNTPPIAIVCPGYCATELNNWSGPRSAEQGGESVVWPIFNDFKTGHFYQDGKELAFSGPADLSIKPPALQ